MSTRNMLVPVAHVELARALAVGLAGSAGSGMWSTPCGPEGTDEITHYISAGPVSDDMATLMPIKVYETLEDGSESYYVVDGRPDIIATQADLPLWLVAGLLASCEVTDEDPFVTLARMELTIKQPKEVL